MLLYPKKTKFKTLFSRKRIKFLNNRFFNSSLKSFAIVAVEAGNLNNKQIESLRKTLKRLLKSQGKYWLSLFPNKTITKKSEGIRMGKGKGNLKFWYSSVSKGTVIAEISGCSWNQTKSVMWYIKKKLSIKVLLTLDRTL
jgi:large subunit ribosomal protein L16